VSIRRSSIRYTPACPTMESRATSSRLKQPTKVSQLRARRGVAGDSSSTKAGLTPEDSCQTMVHFFETVNESTAEWQQLQQNVTMVRRLLQQHPAVIEDSLHRVVPPLAHVVGNKRTAIAREAAQGLVDIVCRIDPSEAQATQPFLHLTVVALLHNTALPIGPWLERLSQLNPLALLKELSRPQNFDFKNEKISLWHTKAMLMVLRAGAQPKSWKSVTGVLQMGSRFQEVRQLTRDLCKQLQSSLSDEVLNSQLPGVAAFADGVAPGRRLLGDGCETPVSKLRSRQSIPNSERKPAGPSSSRRDTMSKTPRGVGTKSRTLSESSQAPQSEFKRRSRLQGFREHAASSPVAMHRSKSTLSEESEIPKQPSVSSRKSHIQTPSKNKEEPHTVSSRKSHIQTPRSGARKSRMSRLEVSASRSKQADNPTAQKTPKSVMKITRLDDALQELAAAYAAFKITNCASSTIEARNRILALRSLRARLEQPASTEQPNSTCELLSNNELSCSSNNDLSCSRNNDFSSSRNNDLSCSRNNDLSSSRNNDLSSSRGRRRGLHSLLTPTLSSRAKKKEQTGAPSPRSNKVSKGLQPRALEASLLKESTLMQHRKSAVIPPAAPTTAAAPYVWPGEQWLQTSQMQQQVVMLDELSKQGAVARQLDFVQGIDSLYRSLVDTMNSEFGMSVKLHDKPLVVSMDAISPPSTPVTTPVAAINTPVSAVTTPKTLVLNSSQTPDGSSDWLNPFGLVGWEQSPIKATSPDTNSSKVPPSPSNLCRTPRSIAPATPRRVSGFFDEWCPSPGPRTPAAATPKSTRRLSALLPLGVNSPSLTPTITETKRNQHSY